MIAGFGNSSGSNVEHFFSTKHTLALPMPFNIPRVLHNLLFEDTAIEFDAKQKDLLETLRFSYIALGNLGEKYKLQKAKLKEQILAQPDNIDLKNELQDLKLDKQQANYDFKNLTEIMLELLQKEQIEALLKFSKVLK